MVEVIGQFRDELAVLATLLADICDSRDLAISCLDDRELLDCFCDTYLLSRGLAFHDISLTIAQAYRQVSLARRARSESLITQRSEIRMLKGQLEDAIQRVDRVDGLTLGDRIVRDEVRSTTHGERHRINDTCFQPDVLETLIQWELSANRVLDGVHVEVNAAEMRTFAYAPIPIATFLSRLIRIVASCKQREFEVNIENRGLSIVIAVPLPKPSIVESLLDPSCDLYFLSRIAESSGISLIVDEQGIRMVMSLRMPERSSINADYDALAAIVDNPFVPRYATSNDQNLQANRSLHEC